MATERAERSYQILGESISEIERLALQHRWVQKCVDDRIVFAPVDLRKPDLKVLDVGCSNGLLLRDLRKDLPPSAELVGVDADPAVLPTADGNISYALWDINEAPGQDLQAEFDLVNVRFVLAGAFKAGVEKVVSHLAATLAPGGWLQVQELDLTPDQPGQGLANNYVQHVIWALFEKLGLGGFYSLQLPAMFEAAGLINVKLEHLQYPMGRHERWADDPAWQRDSIVPFKQSIPAMLGAAKMIGADIPDNLSDDLPERFHREMAEQGGYFRDVIVTGQKPVASS